MRVLIVTAGSRGDVAPFTGLGQRLQEAGYQVAIAAHGLFAGLVRGCGLEYRPLPGDPVELARARTAAPSPEAGRSLFTAFQLGVAPPPLPQRDLTADGLAEAIRSCLDDLSYRHRATTLANRIRAEDGAAAVLTLINELAH